MQPRYNEAMLLPNPEIDERALAGLVAARYGAAPTRLAFAPVGGDGWHYRCPPFWVSVRRDRQGHCPAAYRAAGELRDAGLDFVLAPLPDATGRIVHRLGRFPVVVLPLVEGATLFEAGLRRGEAEQIHGMCLRLHAARGATPLAAETFDLPFRDELRSGLERALHAGPHLGPYAEALRDLIARNRSRILAMLAETEALAVACRADPLPFVPTHGEPDHGNVLRDTAGRLYLIDWGELRLGPPERDWASLEGLGLAPPARAPFMRFYHLRWDLGEIAEYTARFAAPHPGNAEDDDRWGELRLYLQ
jgi:spectinomycin phosphotransferase